MGNQAQGVRGKVGFQEDIHTVNLRCTNKQISMRMLTHWESIQSLQINTL